ncbi:hypothetical protein EVAR_48623_1 [Eumeta japonica]|uniref:Uncharacterized protein n=1 Tax=Eumeta variegata TaxID=151549 RepID=A0A4C1Y135_EUMVA|nr:hypothetical protein EVAR_48623_1 [Eumeta japonica]
MSLPSTFQRYGRKFAIQDQLIAILIVPYLVYISDKYLEDEDYRKGVDIYTMKLSNIISEQIVKASYSFRDLVEESDKKIVAIQATKQIFKLKGHINSEQAGTIYQALFYVLKQHYFTDASGALITTDIKLKSADDIKLISLTLDAIIMLLKDHNINWYESFEIVCLYNCLMNLLKPKLLPSKLVMQVLDLVNLTVKKFLPPDLSLLMESKSGSALMEIAEVISAGMIAQEWEVRDSAMHLLLTCTEISFVKYTPFQKLISVNGLITTAAHIAMSDPEHYVQGMALRCLAAAARVDSIWRDLLVVYPHINLQLMYVLRKHSEGLVRKEAANVLTEIYVNQKVFLGFKNNLHGIMGAAALDDLHWEVQLSALQFLKKSIQSMLADCGMIDGKFPSVTFSKEKRKIVALTKEEIQKQLMKILNELARFGCLSVLNKCMNEDFNISVMEQAYNITKELVEILVRYDVATVQSENYKYPINIAFNGMDIDLAMDLTFSPRNNAPNDRDKVIDSILSINHSELIENMYDNHVEIKTENMDEDMLVSCIVTSQVYLDPNEFLNNFRNIDYLNMITEKRLWNSDQKSLNSLLDEILSSEGCNCVDLECN